MPSTRNKVQPQNISHEHELDSKGVYQLANGAWAYRFCKSVNGKNVYKRASTDRKGNPLLTQRDAMLAREEAMLEAQGVYTPVISTLGIVYRPSATIEEVYEDYCANGRGDRSHNTIKRQDTLWRTYLKADFGKKRFNGISLGEIQDYLANKYYVEGYSYRYVESFLKMFYLFFGQAYSRNYIPAELYNQFCVNKETKIRMPKIKRDEDLSIVSFTDEECAVMDEYFKGTNAETAYLLGRHCGLRINETFGLKWCNVDLENGTITIDRQMQYQEGIIKLVAPKTRNSRRTIYMSDVLRDHLIARAKMLEAEAQKLAAIVDVIVFPHIGRVIVDFRAELIEAEAASDSLEHLRENNVIGFRHEAIGLSINDFRSLHHQIVSKPVKSFARIILKSINISLGERRLHDFQSLGSHLLGFHLHRESSRTVHRETSFHSLSELCYLGLGSLVFPSPYIYIIHRT